MAVAPDPPVAAPSSPPSGAAGTASTEGTVPRSDDAAGTSAPAATDPVPDPAAGPVAPVWTVQPGDHLWHIAEVTVRAAHQGAATDREIAAYWQVLIAANRDRLAVPGVADLILPGQQFVLPPVAAAA